jgi:predicted AAA+ superfamily ATPase
MCPWTFISAPQGRGSAGALAEERRRTVRELYPSLAENLPSESVASGNLQSEAARRHLEPLAVHLNQLALAWERYLSIGGFPRAVADALGRVDVAAATANGLWNILVGDVLRVGSMSDRDVKARSCSAWSSGWVRR